VTPPPEALDELVALVREGHLEAFIARAHHLEAPDLADVLASLDAEARLTLVRALPAELSSKALIELPADEHPESIVAALDSSHAAEIVEELEDDDAADLLGELTVVERDRILAGLPEHGDLDRLLGYGQDTAGGLMTTQVVTVMQLDTVGLALEAVRRQAEDLQDVGEIFVIRPDGLVLCRISDPTQLNDVAKHLTAGTAPTHFDTAQSATTAVVDDECHREHVWLALSNALDQADPSDREAMLVRLTECAARHERNLDRVIGARDRARFLSTLRKVMADLD